MTGKLVNRALLAAYMLGFFGFLFAPVLVMGVTAFNASSYPQVLPFEGVTLQWFATLLADQEMLYGIGNSLRIGVFVVLLSVPLGLAGAIVMQQVYVRARGIYYLVVVAPVLTPGIIIGISTVIFWRGFTGMTGTRFLYDGTVLTVLGQSSFIASYCMLIFLARLQRFDPALAEAALDLGATPAQAFRDVLLPFLRPAVFSAAVIAFLSSFENYNTTTFAILADKTLVTILAGRMRQGLTPAVSALAVVIVSVTVLGAVLFELLQRRDDRRRVARQREAQRAERCDEAGPVALAALSN
jgi:spermidine/putrescine transport system permease protein